MVLLHETTMDATRGRGRRKKERRAGRRKRPRDASGARKVHGGALRGWSRRDHGKQSKLNLKLLDILFVRLLYVA